MLKYYATIATRNLVKNKGFSLITIAGLAISLTAFILIFQFIVFERSFDSFHNNADRIFRVESKFFKNGEMTDNWATSSSGYGMALANTYPQITGMTRIWLWNRERIVQYEDVRFRENNVVAADSSFFQLFNFPLVVGNPAEVLREPNSVVISESYRKKYFGTADPIGKVLKLSDVRTSYECVVSGVFSDMPRNSHLHYDIIFSWATIASQWKDMDHYWYKHSAYTYVSLASPDDTKLIEKEFPDLAEKHKTLDALKELTWGVELVPLKDIHLNAWKAEEFEIKGSRSTVSFLGVLAVIIMVIALINHVNLTTVKSFERLREVGIRKVSGVLRHQLITQYLLESVLLALASLLASVVLVVAFKTFFSGLFPGIDTPFQNPTLIVVSVILLVIVGAIASGLYPAIVLSSIKPTESLKGDARNSIKGNGFRKTLVTLQFMASAILISVTVLIYKQVAFMKSKETGISTEQTVIIHAPVATPQWTTFLETFRTDLLRRSEVKAVTYSSSVPGGEVGMFLANRSIHETETTLYEMLRTDHYYLDLYNLSLVNGRNFSRDIPTDESAVIINEQAVKQLKFASAQEALHHEVYLEASDKKFQIIGVANDFHQTSLENPYTPIMIFISPDYGWIPYRFFSIKLQTDNYSGSIAYLEETWKKHFPESPMDWYFLDDFFGKMYEKEESSQRIFAAGCGLAVFISCLGLLGLTHYTVTLRKKEIGIRKVLGASVPGLLLHFSRSYVVMTVIAFLLAAPVSWFVLKDWLEGYTFRTEIDLWVFVMPMLLLLPITFLTISALTFKAASVNPISSLRYE